MRRRNTHQAEINGARKSQILRITPDLRVGEEECHGNESAYDHCPATTPEVFGAAHEACQHRARNPTQVRDGIVAPDLAVSQATELGASCADVDGEEDVEERIGEANEKLEKESEL